MHCLNIRPYLKPVTVKRNIWLLFKLLNRRKVCGNSEQLQIHIDPLSNYQSYSTDNGLLH